MESAPILALVWGLYSTYFFSLFPFLTHPDELLLEVLPCYLHICFTLTTNFLWSSILLYIHHRNQIAIDARKCGVWEKVSSFEHHKCPNWRSGYKYSQNSVVTSSSKLYKLVSTSSSYPFAPVEGLLKYRKHYLPLLAADTGPLYKSKVLSYLFTGVIVNICALLGSMLILPTQVQYILFRLIICNFVIHM